MFTYPPIFQPKQGDIAALFDGAAPGFPYRLPLLAVVGSRENPLQAKQFACNPLS